LAFVKISDTSEIPAGKMKAVQVEGKQILIANVDGRYYAMGNKCTHAGGDLSSGTLSGNIVTCPRHGAQFDVTSGKVVSGPKLLFIRLKIKDEEPCEVRVDGKDILLKID